MCVRYVLTLASSSSLSLSLSLSLSCSLKRRKESCDDRDRQTDRQKDRQTDRRCSGIFDCPCLLRSTQPARSHLRGSFSPSGRTALFLQLGFILFCEEEGIAERFPDWRRPQNSRLKEWFVLGYQEGHEKFIPPGR